MKRTIGWLTTILAAASLLGTAILPSPAWASEKGRRNTAIVLGAAAVYELFQHKTTNGLVLGAGAAYAYKKYNDERKQNRRYRRVFTHRYR